MSPDRQWRIKESFKGDHVNGYVDHLLSPILQGTKEGIGALLEGKNRWLDRLLNKYLPDKPISGKSSRLGKGRRAVANQGIRRLILLWNGLIDTVGTAVISVADVINHTQGAVSDVLLKKKTTEEPFTATLHGIGDVARRRLIKEAVRNWLVKNKVGSSNFAGTTNRNYSPTWRPPTPTRNPAPVPATP